MIEKSKNDDENRVELPKRQSRRAWMVRLTMGILSYSWSLLTF